MQLLWLQTQTQTDWNVLYTTMNIFFHLKIIIQELSVLEKEVEMENEEQQIKLCLYVTSAVIKHHQSQC